MEQSRNDKFYRCESIAAAMKADWEKVGGDISGACNRAANGES
jgi:hypothetical protein